MGAPVTGAAAERVPHPVEPGIMVELAIRGQFDYDQLGYTSRAKNNGRGCFLVQEAALEYCWCAPRTEFRMVLVACTGNNRSIKVAAVPVRGALFHKAMELVQNFDLQPYAYHMPVFEGWIRQVPGLTALNNHIQTVASNGKGFVFEATLKDFALVLRPTYMQLTSEGSGKTQLQVEFVSIPALDTVAITSVAPNLEVPRALQAPPSSADNNNNGPTGAAATGTAFAADDDGLLM